MTKEEQADLASMWIDDNETIVFNLWSSLDGLTPRIEQDEFEEMNYLFCKVLFMLLIVDRQ